MAEFETTTRTGKVIYKRKKHYFDGKDLVRVWKGVRRNLVFVNLLDEQKARLSWVANDILKFIGENVQQTNEERDPEEIRSAEGLLSTITIELMTEIIEKIPFIPQKLEREISEFIYWNVIAFLDSIIYPSKRKEN